MNKKIGIFDFLESLNPNTLGAVYSCNGLVLLTDKEYSFRLEQIRELQAKANQLETNRDEAIELLKSKNNGKCIINGKEKNAYTFVLDFDKAREFIWELEEILERGKE